MLECGSLCLSKVDSRKQVGVQERKILFIDLLRSISC